MPAAIIDDMDRINHAISDVYQGYCVCNDVNRTLEMADFIQDIQKTEFIQRPMFFYISDIASLKYKDDSYRFTWDEISFIVRDVLSGKDNIRFNDFYPFIHDCDESLPLDEMVRLAHIHASAEIKEELFHKFHPDTFVRRIHFYWERDIDDDVIAEYEKRIRNDGYNEVAGEFLSNSYPTLSELLSLRFF